MPVQPTTLLEWLTVRFPAAKRTTLKRMLQAGRVQINGQQARRMNLAIGAADDVRIVDAIKRPGPSIEPLRIVFEDEDLLIVDKPPGLLTSTTPREQRETAIAIVKKYLAESGNQRGKAGLIHRLDRDAGGLLVFSKNDIAYQSLKTQFFRHDVDRVYTAVVHGVPSPSRGRIDSHLLKHADGTVYSTKKHATGQRAITDYEVVSSAKGRSVLQVKLFTGRKHQIRVHLSERGWPIVGDRVYGRKNDPEERLMLKATGLGITHPRSNRRVRFELPAD